MIIFTQTGQAGKTKYLFDMHRLRKKVFADRMGWNVNVTKAGLEVDDYDLENAVYLLSVENDRVVGSWRLLPTDGPTMIEGVWPEFLQSIDMPSSAYIWEASRFGVLHEHEESAKANLSKSNNTSKEMFQALTQMCIQCGIEYIFTLYDKRIARLLKQLNCEPIKLSKPVEIDGIPCWVGAFKTDEKMLRDLQNASGVFEDLYDPNDLPPALQTLVKNQEKIYA